MKNEVIESKNEGDLLVQKKETKPRTLEEY